jgi:hypothetical protein
MTANTPTHMRTLGDLLRRCRACRTWRSKSSVTGIPGWGFGVPARSLRGKQYPALTGSRKSLGRPLIVAPEFGGRPMQGAGLAERQADANARRIRPAADVPELPGRLCSAFVSRSRKTKETRTRGAVRGARSKPGAEQALKSYVTRRANVPRRASRKAL